MNKVKVELVLSESTVFFADLDYNLVQLMLNSNHVTIGGNTVKVRTTEVTSQGLIRFYGTKVSREPGSKML